MLSAQRWCFEKCIMKYMKILIVKKKKTWWKQFIWHEIKVVPDEGIPVFDSSWQTNSNKFWVQINSHSWNVRVPRYFLPVVRAMALVLWKGEPGKHGIHVGFSQWLCQGASSNCATWLRANSQKIQLYWASYLALRPENTSVSSACVPFPS